MRAVLVVMPVVMLVVMGSLIGGVAQAEERDDDAITMTVQGARAVASGYDARGSLNQHLTFDVDSSQPSASVSWLTTLPGVAENGQGGWVQMWSLNGLSGQRVLTLLAGIPVLTDRRAGTAGHFVDPVLLSQASVLTGPASSIYGNGALGGIVQLAPQALTGATLGMQADDNGDGRSLYAGWGDDDSQLMLAMLSRDNSVAGNDQVINDHGERASALLQQRWQIDGGELALVALPAVLRDVGRANANFYNNRITETPEETHLPVRLSYRADSGWEAAAFMHDNHVITDTHRVGVSNTRVENDAVNWGISAQKPWQFTDWHSRLGMEWQARSEVDANEAIYNELTTATNYRSALAGGEEGQFSLFAEAETELAGGELQMGVRAAALQQSAVGESDVSDQAMSAHLGWERSFASGWRVFASAGQGVRFPALTERFYNGTTPRGFLIGNTELEPEKALSMSAGFTLQQDRLTVSSQLFRQDIDDFIEQVVVNPAPQINQFVNLRNGQINGATLAASWTLATDTSLQFGVHHIRGESDSGTPLADVPADRIRIGVEQHFRACVLSVGWVWRGEKSNPGPDEQVLAESDYGDGSLNCELGSAWQLNLAVSNASDETYLAGADSQSALMPGRLVSLKLVWH